MHATNNIHPFTHTLHTHTNRHSQDSLLGSVSCPWTHGHVDWQSHQPFDKWTTWLPPEPQNAYHIKGAQLKKFWCLFFIFQVGKDDLDMSKTPPVSSKAQLNHPLVNQYSLTLGQDLGQHDTKSLIKCVETLSFIVRDAAHVTPDNFELCVRAIRVFVEASLNGGETWKYNWTFKGAKHLSDYNEVNKYRLRRYIRIRINN